MRKKHTHADRVPNIKGKMSFCTGSKLIGECWYFATRRNCNLRPDLILPLNLVEVPLLLVEDRRNFPQRRGSREPALHLKTVLATAVEEARGSSDETRKRQHRAHLRR